MRERGPLRVELKWKLWQARGRAERGRLCPECGSRHVWTYRLCSRVPPGPGVFGTCRECGWNGRQGEMRRTRWQRIVWRLLGRMKLPDFSSLPGLRGYQLPFAIREQETTLFPVVEMVEIKPMEMPTMSPILLGVDPAVEGVEFSASYLAGEVLAGKPREPIQPAPLPRRSAEDDEA